jgi:Cu(I)/Ag(I) efflux system membrane fusion protein
MKQKVFLIPISVIFGVFIGWLFFHTSRKNEVIPVQSIETAKSTIWTCSMHPQIRMSEPGKCPICGMDLIPLVQSGTSIDPDAVQLSKEAAQLANVLTTIVTKQTPVKELHLYGKVQADERLFQSQVAHVPGRIEKLSVNFTGETVMKGQILAEIYSPELITAQQELLETVKTRQLQPELYEASKGKLRQWKFTDDQITNIEKSGAVRNNFEVASNTTGTVITRKINVGDYVSQGSVLFEIADLSKVWVMFDAYESDLQFLRKGENITFTLQALPGISFKGNIVFIDPVIDPVTRVAKVRVETGNPSGKLKPEMFATGIVSSVLSDYPDNIVIPKTAVLWTGKRSIVYVKVPETDEPVFKIREVELGPMLGESYVIVSGLSEGELIVTSGTFSVDAAAQLEGKPSMMNPGGGLPPSMPGMDMSDETMNSKTGSDQSDEKGKALAGNFSKSTFDVSGNCELCKERIEKAALSVNGVSNANWDMKKKNIDITFDISKTNLMAVQKAIAGVGHDTQMIKAEDNIYKSLPECCLYRK